MDIKLAEQNTYQLKIVKLHTNMATELVANVIKKYVKLL